MKQLGLLTIAGITLMSIIVSTGAQSTEECPGLAVTKIARNNIEISWNRNCFNDTSFLVKATVNDNSDCNATIPCDGETLCTISIRDMSCDINPCDNVTMKVTGTDDSTKEESISTNVAPYLKSVDWKLENSIITGENILNAKWGPPDDSSSSVVSCATKAHVEVPCVGQIEGNSVDKSVYNSSIQGNAMFNVSNCIEEESITLTVTYMAAGDILTDTTKSITLPNPNYNPGTTSPSPETTSLTSEITYTTDDDNTTDTTPPTPFPKDNSLSPGAIAGIVISILAVVVIIAGFAYSYTQKKLFFK